MQKIFKISLLIVLSLILSCKKKKTAVTNPNQVNTNVNEYIYKNTPEFNDLIVAGGSIYHSGGTCGLIIYRLAMNETNGDFAIFERNCPHEGGTNTNAKVYRQNDLITARDTVCGSKFYITDGSIINGPSAYPLKAYNYTYDGNVLHIYN
ncbi:MAG: hypothetical protein Q8M29_18560 [Bacteroidota bacterium]|nr:hypothetical protein [Bacteroidota bacterium]